MHGEKRILVFKGVGVVDIISEKVPLTSVRSVDSYGVVRYRTLIGLLHREDGPAIEWASENKEWWIHGELHREDGPARITTRGMFWWYHGKKHREGGPAEEFSNGGRYWYINGDILTEEEHDAWRETHVSI